MTTTTHTTCPTWCELPEAEHEIWNADSPDECRMHSRPLDQWQPDHPDADASDPICVYVQGGRYTDGYSWDEVRADGDAHPAFLGGVGLPAADARRLGEALIRGADLIEGKSTEAPGS